jgi:hypothetical protein
MERNTVFYVSIHHVNYSDSVLVVTPQYTRKRARIMEVSGRLSTQSTEVQKKFQLIV